MGQVQPYSGVLPVCQSTNCASLKVSPTPSAVLAARTAHSSDYLVRNPSPFLGGAKPGRLSSGCSSIPIQYHLLLVFIALGEIHFHFWCYSLHMVRCGFKSVVIYINYSPTWQKIAIANLGNKASHNAIPSQII